MNPRCTCAPVKLTRLTTMDDRMAHGCKPPSETPFLWIFLFRVCRTSQSRLTAMNGMMVHLAGRSQSVFKKEEAFRCTETATVCVCSMSLHQLCFLVTLWGNLMLSQSFHAAWLCLLWLYMRQITSSSGEQQNLTLHTSEWPFLICSSSMLHKGSYYEDCENVLYIQ